MDLMTFLMMTLWMMPFSEGDLVIKDKVVEKVKRMILGH